MVVVFAVWLYDNAMGDAATRWVGSHQWIALSLMSLIFLHLLMKAIYEKFSAVEKERDEIEKERNALKSIIDQHSASEMVAKITRLEERLAATEAISILNSF